MDLRFFVARKEKREIYSMETIVNIVLLPWTLFEWGFSLIMWYILVSWIVKQKTQYGIEGSSITDWCSDAWYDLKHALKFRK